MSRYEVVASDRFWLTAVALKPKYTHDQFAEIINAIKDAIRELAEKGFVEEAGWSEHRLLKPPYADGCHFEFHTYDDDVLVVYFRRERTRVIRMIGSYDHVSLPSN